MCAMDAKLNHSRTVIDSKSKSIVKKRRLLGYVQELKEELKKVSWTPKEDLKFLTLMVVGTTVLFGLGIYVVDLLIKGGLDFVALIVRFIFG